MPGLLDSILWIVAPQACCGEAHNRRGASGCRSHCAEDQEYEEHVPGTCCAVAEAEDRVSPFEEDSDCDSDDATDEASVDGALQFLQDRAARGGSDRSHKSSSRGLSHQWRQPRSAGQISSRRSSNAPGPLVVPAAFNGLSLDESSGDRGEQRRTLHSLLQAFVRAMLRGVYAGMVLDNGCPLTTILYLDRDLENLELHVEGTQQAIPLRDITAIASRDDVTQLTAGTQRELLRKAQLDQTCVALMLSDRRFVVLQLSGPRAREYFEVCLRVLVAAKGLNSAESMIVEDTVESHGIKYFQVQSWSSSRDGSSFASNPSWNHQPNYGQVPMRC